LYFQVLLLALDPFPKYDTILCLISIIAALSENHCQYEREL